MKKKGNRRKFKDLGLDVLAALALIIAVDVLVILMMSIGFNLEALGSTLMNTIQTNGTDYIWCVVLSVALMSGSLALLVSKTDGQKVVWWIWITLTISVAALVWFIGIVKVGFSELYGIISEMFARIPVLAILGIVDIALVIVAIVSVRVVSSKAKEEPEKR